MQCRWASPASSLQFNILGSRSLLEYPCLKMNYARSYICKRTTSEEVFNLECPYLRRHFLLFLLVPFLNWRFGNYYIVGIERCSGKCYFTLSSRKYRKGIRKLPFLMLVQDENFTKDLKRLYVCWIRRPEVLPPFESLGRRIAALTWLLYWCSSFFLPSLGKEQYSKLYK